MTGPTGNSEFCFKLSSVPSGVTKLTMWESARLQSGYSHEIDKRNENRTDRIFTSPHGKLALQASRCHLSKDVNHGFQLALNSHLRWLKTYRQTNKN